MSSLYGRLLIKYRGWLLLAAGIVTVVMASPLIPLDNVRFDFSFRRLFRFEGDDLKQLARFKERFGDDGGAFGVLYVAQDENPHRAAVLAPDFLASMARLEGWVEARKEVDPTATLSPLSATDFYGEPLKGEAMREMRDVLAAAQEDPEGAAARWQAEVLPAELLEYGELAKRLMDHELYQGVLLSEDGTTAAAHFRFNLEYVHPSSRRGFLAELDQFVEAEQERMHGRARVHLFGIPVVSEEYTRLSIKDIVTTAPLSTGVMALLLFFFLRTFLGVLLPLVVVSMAVVWSIGLMQLTDEPINILNHIVPVMVLVLGISDSVHLVLRYMEERRKGLSRKEAASEMAGAMSRACFLTNFTNGVGFASLATATIATVASFGIYTGIACMLTFVANIAVLPAVLSYWGPDSTTVVDSARIDRWFESFARFLIRRKTPLFVGGIALNVGGVLLGVWLVGVDTKLLEEVPPSNRVHQATKAIEERLTPVIAHDVLVEGKTLAGIDCDRDEDCGKEGFVCNQVDRVRAALTPYRDAFYKLDSPKGLAYLDRLEERLRAAQGKMRGQCIATVQSPELLKALDGAGKAVLAHPEASRHARRVDTLAAVVRQMHKAMKKGAPEADTVPDSLSAVSQLLLPLESAAADLTARYASPDYAATRLTVHLRDHGSIAWKTVEPVLASEVKRRFDRDPSLAERFNYVITGTMSYVAKALSFIIHDLLSSLVTAFIPIFFIIGFLFRSVRIAFLSILPNTIPLAMTLVFMAVAGVNLRVSTIIIFSVSLGIAVNDTIHLLARYKEEIGRGLNREEAVITAVRMVGPGMFIATAILAVGFLVNLVSEFIALKQFGYLASFTMVSALFGDLFLTVPCILILGGKEKKDKRAH